MPVGGQTALVGVSVLVVVVVVVVVVRE